jgi:peroxiredoxin
VSLLVLEIAVPWLIVSLFAALGVWIGFQLIHQNGRLLSRLEALEHRLGEIITAAARAPAPAALPAPMSAPAPSAAPPPALPLGSPAPAFELPDLSGRRRSLPDFRGRRLLLLFFNPGCGFCTQMVPDLAALPTDGADGRPLPLVLTTGAAEENRKLFEEHGVRCPVLLQHGMEVASQYQCNGTPMGYLIDEQGHVASGLAIGAQALLALATDGTGRQGDGATGRAEGNGHGTLGGKRPVEESRLQRNGLPAGSPAPHFRLPLLYGGELALEEYRGRKVLLVFSDPHCGPCDQLMPRLEREYRASGELQVLLVSRGEAEANRAKAAAHGLTFPVVLQRQWEISREYGMFATPIAYRIDEAGIIAREVAVGVEPILALLSQPVVAPSSGKGKVARHGKELARRR